MLILRHLLVAFANVLPRYQIVDYIRASIYRVAGLRIGANTRISGPLILDKSLRTNTLKFISIGRNVYINYNCRIAASNSYVTIGDDCLIGPNVTFETTSHPADPYVRRNKERIIRGSIQIGNNVWIGSNAVILPGVIVPSNNVIAAGAVVAKSLEEEGLVVGGVPARIIKQHPAPSLG